MDFKKQQALRELKRRYAYDIATLKKSDINKELTEEELYKSLLLFDVQNKIIENINDYADALDNNPQEVSVLVGVLFNTAGEILSRLAGQDPAIVILYKQTALDLFNQHIKDFTDDSES